MSQYLKNPKTFLLTHTHTLLMKTTQEVCKYGQNDLVSLFLIDHLWSSFGSRGRIKIRLHCNPREQVFTWLCCKENRFHG